MYPLTGKGGVGKGKGKGSSGSKSSSAGKKRKYQASQLSDSEDDLPPQRQTSGGGGGKFADSINRSGGFSQDKHKPAELFRKVRGCLPS